MKPIKKVRKSLAKLWAFVCRVVEKWRRKPAPLYTLMYVEDFPDQLKPHVIYLLGDRGKEWLAGFSCPCGCGETIELVLNGRSPSWKLVVSKKGVPSLYPSVWRSVNCGSHFFLKDGRIRWCR
jgi:hypothetical protein